MGETGVSGGMTKGAPTVVYVAGLAYSGTTLFSAALGYSDGFVNGGEINYVENDYHGEMICSCQKLVDECDFWRALFAKLEEDEKNGATVLNFSAGQRLRPIDSRSMPIGTRLSALLGASVERLFGADEVTDYSRRHFHFFRALSDVADAGFVIDASKGFLRLEALLKNQEMPLHVIFLRRPLVQLYASRLKRAKRRNKYYTPLMAPVYLANIAMRVLSASSQLKRIPPENLSVVEYETFVAEPERVQEQLSKRLKAEVNFGIRDGIVPVDHLHIFTGNVWLPRALEQGEPVRLRVGDGRSTLSATEKLVYYASRPLTAFLERRLYRLGAG